MQAFVVDAALHAAARMEAAPVGNVCRCSEECKAAAAVVELAATDTISTSVYTSPTMLAATASWKES